MRIKALTKFNFSTMRNAIIIFYLCYIGATLAASVINAISKDSVVILGFSSKINEQTQVWSSSIFAFAIFMLVSSLIGSQNDTRFLITRSVSRKEIFVANALSLCCLSAIMSILQVVSIYIDSFARWCTGLEWRGLALDLQIHQAPNMSNAFIFLVLSFAILLAFGAAFYLFGSLLARWKIQTIIATAILIFLSITLIGSSNLMIKIFELFEFMFTDNVTGLLVALKQVIFAGIAMLISFPIMRKTTAVGSVAKP